MHHIHTNGVPISIELDQSTSADMPYEFIKARVSCVSHIHKISILTQPRISRLATKLQQHVALSSYKYADAFDNN